MAVPELLSFFSFFCGRASRGRNTFLTKLLRQQLVNDIFVPAVKRALDNI